MAKEINAHQYFFTNFFIWLKLLYHNKGVGWRFIPKALIITILSFVSLPFQLINAIMIRWKYRKIRHIEDPIFIIGHWRSGTTFLHYLMALDKRFGYLNYYHAFIPNLALVGGRLLKAYMAYLTPKTRPQDNIVIKMNLPSEEENPLATFSSRSASHSFFFPKNETYYKKYILFDGINETEKKLWQKAYFRILRQISVSASGRRLVIKNPHNTGRIRELLELFPKAQFIHIYRHPYDVFPSTRLMYNKVVVTQFLQDYTSEQIDDKIIYYYKSMMGRFFEDKNLIPKEQLVELKFEEFEKDPMPYLKNIYERFDLDLNEEREKNLVDYLSSLKDYKKNKHDISPDIKEKINREWDFAFKEFNYEKS